MDNVYQILDALKTKKGSFSNTACQGQRVTQEKASQHAHWLYLQYACIQSILVCASNMISYTLKIFTQKCAIIIEIIPFVQRWLLFFPFPISSFSLNFMKNTYSRLLMPQFVIVLLRFVFQFICSQSTIYSRMYLNELLICDKRKFKRSYMALIIRRDKKDTIYIDTLLFSL